MANGIIHAPGWVYSLADYQQMFDLNDADFNKTILDYPGGISSFNAQMHDMNKRVVSGDQLYQLTPPQMDQAVDQIYEANETHLRAHLENLKQQDEASIQNILNTWQQSKNAFLKDYAAGRHEQRYLLMTLPTLPFEFHEFQLALCSDLLFHTQAREGYTPQHLIAELCRVAEEVRVFPLLDEAGQTSDALGPVMLNLQQQNFGVEVREVAYEQHAGGNAMLRVWAKECVVE